MTESNSPQSAGSGTASLDGEGIGPTLRRLREAKNLTPADVCMRLKFSQRQLNALESEQWEQLPDGPSLRGFVRNYARYLEADVDAMMTLLEHAVGRPVTAFVDARAAARLAPGELPVDEGPSRRSWAWLLVILVVVLVAIFYAFDRGWVPDSWLVFDWLKALGNAD